MLDRELLPETWDSPRMGEDHQKRLRGEGVPQNLTSPLHAPTVGNNFPSRWARDWTNYLALTRAHHQAGLQQSHIHKGPTL